MVKLLEEHAKGNPFLAQVGMHYQLNEWVRVPPRPSHPKDWADLVEAWIGAVMKDRLLYDEDDCFEELKCFLGRLWEIRYRDLNGYFLDVGSMEKERDVVKVDILEKGPVVVPGDQLMNTVVDVTSTARTIGYQVTVRVPCQGTLLEDGIIIKGFGYSVEEAEEIAISKAAIIKKGGTLSQFC